MTLVVSEISRHGIIMIGDSAVTYSRGEEIIDVKPGAVKVQYSPELNAGISMWGWGKAGEQSLDKWVADFLKSQADLKPSLEQLGISLAKQINDIRKVFNVPMDESTRSGFHLAGYENGIPRLWHVHTGHFQEHVHELRLYKDYPNDQGISDEQFTQFLQGSGAVHLRNGYHQFFAILFDSVLNYAKTIHLHLQVQFPMDSIEGKVLFYKLLIQFVAGTLKASGLHPSVNEILSVAAFNQNGLLIHEPLPFDLDLSDVTDEYLVGFDNGNHGEPFRWDEVRCAQLRAELDAYYARLYGLTRDELRYTLRVDPKEVHGEDFPGETFRVLKEKEVRLYGEYRTRRLVLESWDKLEG
jgi:hypothetical protein